MADNLPVPEGAPKSPSPSPGAPGSGIKPPPLPAASQIKKPGGNKVVVLLSSVAKQPPAVGDAPAPPSSVKLAKIGPPPLPIRKTAAILAPLKPGEITDVKLPPKKVSVRWPTFSGSPSDSVLLENQDGPTSAITTAKPTPPPENKAKPPPLPAQTPELPKKAIVKHAPIKLNQPSVEVGSAADSIFASIDKEEPEHPAGWKELHPGELEQPAGGLESLDVFARSQRILPAPTPEPKVVVPTPVVPTPLAETKPSTEIKVAPPALPPAQPLVTLPPVTSDTPPSVLQPVTVLSKPVTVTETKAVVQPPPLVLEKPAETAAPSSIHHAPPLLVSEPVVLAEKLPQPQLLSEFRKDETPAVAKSPDAPAITEPPPLHKVPALITTEPPATSTPLPALPAKGLSPVAAPQKPSPVSKVTGPITTREKQGPIVLAKPLVEPSPKIEVKSSQQIKPTETKPALRPAVLPSKLMVNPKPIEAREMTPLPAVPTPTPVKVLDKVVEKKPPAPSPAPATSPAPAPESKAVTPPPVAAPTTAKTAEKAPAPKTIPAKEKKAPLPLTRAERAKKRRIVETVVFYVVFALVLLGLYFGSIWLSQETRVEGQVIPPAGMPLFNEVWIVSDFRELSSHIAEDLAAERTPALQEMQYRLDHVQRAQADVTIREERVRMLQGQVQSCKDELLAIGKQARDATQQIWDGPGAELDSEYDARLTQLQKTIQDRATSLKLNYQPDDTYRSPEVWANAYRLALYEVPPGVDSAKEHQWLADQMKQWRDFVKSLDDRKEQLREKAAQIKLAPATKITDLDAKIDELQHRIDNTESEEDPIKTELQQAQTELAHAQSTEAGLDDKYYKQLYALPSENIIKHIPLSPSGRFGWVEEERSFVEGENEHLYWIFAKAVRSDGREYWAMGRISVMKDETHGWIIDPETFVSTKAILRPNLPPDEQAQ